MDEQVEHDDDLALIETCRAGKTEAFAWLVERYKKMVFSLTYRMTGNRWDAEELAQEAFVRAFRRLADFDAKRRFATWLYTIALNLCRDRAKRKRIAAVPIDAPIGRARSLLDRLAGTAPDPERQLAAKEDEAFVQHSLMGLPAGQKEVLILRVQQDLSYAEIAEVLNIPVKQVKARLHRARRKLRALWTEREPNAEEAHKTRR